MFAVRVPGDVGRLPETAVDVRQRRILVALVRVRLRVGGFRLAAEHHHDAAFRVEFDDHVRALVGRPDVVVLVDAHRVGIRPGVEVLADLAQERAVVVEFQKLRGGVAEGRTLARAAARIDEDVALGVDRDARDLAEVQVGRQLQEVGHRLVGNFRRRLCECR